MSRVIGIDLGTTNSVCAYVLGDKFEIIPNQEGDRITPSIVYIKGDQILVGKLAKRKAILEPKNVIYEIKRFMGRKYSEVKSELGNIPYEVKAGPNDEVLVVVDGKEYKPEQISAFILRKIKEDAEKYLGEKIERAVITVPAYFNDAQRQATKAAGEIAGLKVERIINEPTAAALAYGLENKKDQKVAVFDLGGGTFDITIMEIGKEGTFQVLSTNGDTHLGGADFDKRLMDYLINEFKKETGIDLKNDPMALQRLKEESENVKKQLSTLEQVEVNIPFIATKDGIPYHLNKIITRAQFERLILDLVDRVVGPTMNALKDAGLNPTDIDEVILVGGSTRVPLVRKKVQEIFGKEPKMTVNPDEAVAAGAALQGGIIQGEISNVLLLDVTPLSLGVEIEGGLVDVVIPRNTTIPTRKTKIYTTATDNQPAVTIHIVQGERPLARDNKSLGMFNLEGIPPMPRGVPQIEVTFDIDVNGILNVSAKEKSTGKQQSITIQGSLNLQKEEIERMQQEANKFFEIDNKRKQILEKINQIDAIIYQLEKDEQKKNQFESYINEIKNFIASIKDNIYNEDLDNLLNQVNEKYNEILSKINMQG